MVVKWLAGFVVVGLELEPAVALDPALAFFDDDIEMKLVQLRLTRVQKGSAGFLSQPSIQGRHETINTINTKKTYKEYQTPSSLRSRLEDVFIDCFYVYVGLI